MTKEALKGITTLVGDLFSTFKPPQTIEGARIWLESLAPYDERLIRNAIVQMARTEQYFSFAVLMQILEGTHQMKLPSSDEAYNEVLAIMPYKRYFEDNAHLLERLKPVTAHALHLYGGMDKFGEADDNQWNRREFARCYEEAKESYKRGEDYTKLTGNDPRLLEFEQ